MGVRFLINGETHYGWIRMSVTAAPYQVTDYITGYAYNTVANQPISAGEGARKPVRAGLDPGTLGILGLGAAGLALWRKKEGELNTSLELRPSSCRNCSKLGLPSL